MLAELSQCIFLVCREENQCITAIISLLMISQQDLNNFIVNPSGQGALFEGRSLIDAFTSSSEKGESRPSRSHVGRFKLSTLREGEELGALRPITEVKWLWTTECFSSFEVTQPWLCLSL